ncbi:MAG: hypothetical protein V3S39_02205 [Thermodesulfobacteriota bacterium]
MRNSLRWLVVGLAIVALAGCVSGRNVILNPAYTREAAPPSLLPGSPPVSMAISLFEDGRPVKDRIGTRRGYRAAPDNFQYGGTSLVELVTKAVQTQVENAGIRTRLISSWDLRQKTIPPAGQKFLLGGRIDSFWMEASSNWMGSKPRLRVELTLVLASPKERRLLWRNTITSTYEYREPYFNRKRAQQAFNIVFSNVVNKILQNPELQSLLGIKPTS